MPEVGTRVQRALFPDKPCATGVSRARWRIKADRGGRETPGHRNAHLRHVDVPGPQDGSHIQADVPMQSWYWWAMLGSNQRPLPCEGK